MAEKESKGEYVDEASTVVRWSVSYSHHVQPNISVEDADVECGEDYIAVIESYNGQNGTQKVTELEVTIHKGERRMTLPRDVIEAYDAIKPGKSIKVTFYDLVEDSEEEINQEDIGTTQISDSCSVLGRAEAGYDASVSDGVGASLYNESMSDYVEKHGECELKFRNTENDKETIGVSHANYDEHSNRICFPIDVRKDIDTTPGDLIEVIAIESENQIDDSEKIEQIYDMVSEMYDAHLSAKND